MPHIPTHSALRPYLVGKDDPLGRAGLIGELGVKASSPTTLELENRLRHALIRLRDIAVETHDLL